MNISINLTS